MIEELAAAAGRDVPRETYEKLETYVAMLGDENSRQNLVSGATLERAWSRHILDSAQLLRFELHKNASWVDIGSGAGLPGIVIACLAHGLVTLIEPRPLRADFLHRVASRLDLDVRIACSKAQRVSGDFDMITARAVAPLSKLIEISAHLSTTKSVWALPKGRNAAAELAEARRAWQGDFRLEASVTEPESFVVVATGVEARP